MTKRRRPILIETNLPETEASPDLAPPVPETEEPVPGDHVMRTVPGQAGGKGFAFGLVFWPALGGLLSLMIGVAFWDFVTRLLTRNQTLGQIALVLAVVVGVVILLFVIREIAGIVRLGRIDRLRRETEAAWQDLSRDTARRSVENLSRFYAGRPEFRWISPSVAARADEIFDADALLELVESSYLAPLDTAARSEIETAVRQVATATALVPLALADVTAALVVNIRMIRRVAVIYGGRAGWLGSLRLLRAVGVHLVATGAVAVGDDLIGSLAGGGLLTKISRRFGEGVVNGALTARVGLAAMEIVRPMPFRQNPRPGVGMILGSALKNVFSSGDTSE